MEKYLQKQIKHCAAQVDRYANCTDKDSRNQWWYWYGQLKAYQSLKENK